jgi:hypothetical protein
MTITASPLTVTRKNAAVSASAYIHTTDPGTFACTYPAGISGPATVTAAGSRVYKIPNDNGAYLALQTSALSSRLGVTIVGKTSIDLLAKAFGAATNGQEFQPLIHCINESAARRVNWGVLLNVFRTGALYTARISYNQSADSGTNDAAYLGAFDGAITGDIRWAVVLPASGTTVPVYMTSRANVVNATRAATSGTMGGSEVVVLQGGLETAVFARELSNDDLDLWFAGTLPATPAAAWMGSHEIDVTDPVIFDTSGNNYDLGDYDVTGLQAANMRALTTDTGFTSPLVEIPITIAADCTAGVKNITLRRTRVGIPARVPALADAVLYDDGTLAVTVAVETEVVHIGPDIVCQVPSYPHSFDLLLSGTYDGSATVVSDDANLVPTSPVTITDGVATVPCVASADITAATVTATGPGGDTGTCSVTVSEVPESTVPIKVGPSQTVRRGSTTISVHISGQDGVVTLASTPHGLDCPASATISGGEVDVAIPIMSVGTYTITATQGVLSDTAVVIVPGNYQATEDYDLVQDIADVIEDMIPASGNAYHYDEIVIGDDGRLDAEDHVFGVRVVGAIEGPIVGGKTIMVEVAVVSFPQVSPADVEALQNYLSQEADWPAYVGAVVCNQVQVNELNGGDIVIYQLEVILG